LLGDNADLKVEYGRMDQYAIAFGGITYIHTGALGAKQMGAGGGGCMIALCPRKGLERVKSALESLGAPAWAFKIVEE
jgi:galactokinase/mevalonate kinase-like predicted kinase